ncbi:hypothetical protein OHB26_03240 [Nocardia sp. NBC_01503]|uniref:hypothetical protein n=1 Tax=Nocardia sp. NBC_01503 TaxID=2975997 RepID=UPI002E7BA2D1|nr:hypothetical protein [Nocardia sp. NBC_01503]WTL33279.1 hypothetical protein OHB26_03240 [Nocardia sp. NBC_01503]
MTITRTITALAVLPVLAAAGHGTAVAAPGQPGLAVPGEGQPGLSTTPAPSMADYLPDPPAPPARPRPQQQTSPQSNLLAPQPQPPTAEPDVQQPDTVPEVVPVDPHTVRAGNTTVAVPDWVDRKTRDKAQAYLDYVEWQIAAGYDSAGFPRDESDRRAASTMTGALVSGTAGAEIVSVPASLAGCGVGAVVGGIAGAAIAGVPTAGTGAGPGAALGGIAGCMVGSVVAAVPGIALGATAGAVLGGAAAGALGGGVDVPKPVDIPPLIEIAAPAAAPQPQAVTVGQQITETIDAVAATNPEVDTVVTSLRSAIAALPPLIPA